MPGLSRTDEIQLFVLHQRGNIWDAFDQGRWAHSRGTPRGNNPHIPGHANFYEWDRGWDAEAERQAKAA